MHKDSRDVAAATMPWVTQIEFLSATLNMRSFQGLLLYSVGVGIFIVPVVNSQVVTSTLTSSRLVCPGQNVSFICVTRGSPTIEWISDEYIERGGPGLQFNKLSQLNIPESSPVNPKTIAFLVNKTAEGGIDVLVSQLHIVVLSEYPTASVTCLHGSGSRRGKSFQLLAVPDMPRDMASDQIVYSSDSDHSSERCIIQASWSAPTNIDVAYVREYMMHVNGTNLLNETNTNNKRLTLASFPVCACGAHRVSVKAVNICGRAGRSTNTTILDTPLPLLPGEDCGDSVSITTPSTSDGIPDGQVISNNPDPCVSPIVFCVLLAMLAATLLAITVVLAVLYSRELMKPKRETYNVNAKNGITNPGDDETKDS